MNILFFALAMLFSGMLFASSADPDWADPEYTAANKSARERELRNFRSFVDFTFFDGNSGFKTNSISGSVSWRNSQNFKRDLKIVRREMRNIKTMEKLQQFLHLISLSEKLAYNYNLKIWAPEIILQLPKEDRAMAYSYLKSEGCAPDFLFERLQKEDPENMLLWLEESYRVNKDCYCLNSESNKLAYFQSKWPEKERTAAKECFLAAFADGLENRQAKARELFDTIKNERSPEDRRLKYELSANLGYANDSVKKDLLKALEKDKEITELEKVLRHVRRSGKIENEAERYLQLWKRVLFKSDLNEAVRIWLHFQTFYTSQFKLNDNMRSELKQEFISFVNEKAEFKEEDFYAALFKKAQEFRRFRAPQSYLPLYYFQTDFAPFFGFDEADAILKFFDQNEKRKTFAEDLFKEALSPKDVAIPDEIIGIPHEPYKGETGAFCSVLSQNYLSFYANQANKYDRLDLLEKKALEDIEAYPGLLSPVINLCLAKCWQKSREETPSKLKAAVSFFKDLSREFRTDGENYPKSYHLEYPDPNEKILSSNPEIVKPILDKYYPREELVTHPSAIDKYFAITGEDPANKKEIIEQAFELGLKEEPQKLARYNQNIWERLWDERYRPLRAKVREKIIKEVPYSPEIVKRLKEISTEESYKEALQKILDRTEEPEARMELSATIALECSLPKDRVLFKSCLEYLCTNNFSDQAKIKELTEYFLEHCYRNYGNYEPFQKEATPDEAEWESAALIVDELAINSGLASQPDFGKLAEGLTFNLKNTVNDKIVIKLLKTADIPYDKMLERLKLAYKKDNDPRYRTLALKEAFTLKSKLNYYDVSRYLPETWENETSVERFREACWYFCRGDDYTADGLYYLIEMFGRDRNIHRSEWQKAYFKAMNCLESQTNSFNWPEKAFKLCFSIEKLFPSWDDYSYINRAQATFLKRLTDYSLKNHEFRLLGDLYEQNIKDFGDSPALYQYMGMIFFSNPEDIVPASYHDENFYTQRDKSDKIYEAKRSYLNFCESSTNVPYSELQVFFLKTNEWRIVTGKDDEGEFIRKELYSMDHYLDLIKRHENNEELSKIKKPFILKILEAAKKYAAINQQLECHNIVERFAKHIDEPDLISELTETFKTLPDNREAAMFDLIYFLSAMPKETLEPAGIVPNSKTLSPLFDLNENTLTSKFYHCSSNLPWTTCLGMLEKIEERAKLREDNDEAALVRKKIDELEEDRRISEEKFEKKFQEEWERDKYSHYSDWHQADYARQRDARIEEMKKEEQEAKKEEDKN